MTIFLDISRRSRDMYLNLQDDDIMKNIFNSGRHKNNVGMQILDWMITDEMKQIEHYRMYTEVFGIDVPLTQSQPTESTHKTHRTTSAPRSPNPDKEVAESSAPRRSTVIRLRLPERRSTRLTPPAPVPTESRENAALVDEHLASEEIEKTSDKESPEVEIAKEKEVEITQETEVKITQETPTVDITNVIIPVNVTDEDEEITDEVYELKRREKGKNVEETRNSPIPTPIRSPRTHTNLVSSDTEKLQELTDTPHTTSSLNRITGIASIFLQALPLLLDIRYLVGRLGMRELLLRMTYLASFSLYRSILMCYTNLRTLVPSFRLLFVIHVDLIIGRPRF
ncbi:hypothetical protein Tco_0890208 [Tanacetum coccineum]|uniref:Uncharacterized protein n=1 Tax=Tanacetum coccineum TaxID=301880 RepID=A0ABQ5BZF8_9ASTR